MSDHDKDKIKAFGQYPTPQWVADLIVDHYFPDLTASDFVIEPTCGPGRFLRALPDHVPAMGVDLDPVMARIAREYSGRHVIEGDFLTVDLPEQPTMMIGNPPFNLDLIDGILDRAHRILPWDGRMGLILPAYALQTARRVAGYSDHWSLKQDMIPRNIFEGLKLPLVFATFIKERVRTMIGFSFYLEAAAIQSLKKEYRHTLVHGGSHKSGWRSVIEDALRSLGGRANLTEIYQEIEGKRPTKNPNWREQVRKILRQHFEVIGRAVYGLHQAELDLTRLD